MKLNLTLYKTIKALLGLFFIVLFIVYICFSDLGFDKDLQFYMYIVLPLILIFVLPVFIIYLNYYFASKKLSYEICPEKIVIIKNTESKVFYVNQIKEIVLYMTANRSKGSPSTAFVFEHFFYAKIFFSNNEVAIITSLYSDKIDQILINNFCDVKITKNIMLYPIIKSISP